MRARGDLDCGMTLRWPLDRPLSVGDLRVRRMCGQAWGATRVAAGVILEMTK